MWTEDGIAVLGTYIQQYEMYKNALAEVNDELAKYQKEYKGNEKYYKKLGIDSEQELYDKRRELIDQQGDYAKAVSDTEQSVVDMYESQIDAIEDWSNKAVDAYNDYIDVVKEALDAERDLHDFKRSIEDKTKDISTIERRIASLSGSTDASDIAERQRLEAELYEARQDLDDTYYDHSKDAQSDALDDESSAYEESMNNYINNLRETLDEAKLNMDLFLEQVTTSVMLNADIIKTKYEETGLVIDEALTSPWDAAIEALKKYEIDGMAVMNAWTTEGGFFSNFNKNATNHLKAPWKAGTTAMNTFKNDVKTSMENVVSTVKSNVSKAKTELSNLYKQIQDTEKKASNVKSTSGSTSGNNSSNGDYTDGNTSSESVKALQEVLNTVINAGLKVNGSYDGKTKDAVKKIQKIQGLTADGYYGSKTRTALIDYIESEIRKYKNGPASSYALSAIDRLSNAKKKVPAAMYAKGTLGTKKDEWAIDSEPQFGDELVLVPTAQGNLSYMRKGTAVMPADISANLIEWGKLNPDTMNMAKFDSGINLMSNYVNKPELKLDIENFLRCDNVSQDTLPELKKFVNEQMNSLIKQLNYSLKRAGAK